MTATSALTDRVRDVRRLFLGDDPAGATRLLGSTLEEFAMDSHSESWLRAALNSMSYGHACPEGRHVATVVRCLDNVVEAAADASAVSANTG